MWHKFNIQKYPIMSHYLHFLLYFQGLDGLVRLADAECE